MTTIIPITSSTLGFEPNLKVTPRLVYRLFRASVIAELSESCSEIIDQYGLLFFMLSDDQWAALPGITTLDGGNDVIAPGYDIIAPLVQPANNNALALELYKNQRDERKVVKKAIKDVTRKFVNSLPADDISILSDREGMFGMMNVTLQQLFAHTEQKYATLNQADFDHIFEELQKPKSPSQDYTALAEKHRGLHLLLAAAHQVSTEYSKTKYFMQALKEDPAGIYATEIYVRAYPAIPDRTFDDLVDITIVHAPNYVATTASLGYNNAMMASHTASANAAAIPTDEASLAALISLHQKNLSAMRRKNGNASTAGPRNQRSQQTPTTTAPKYCHKHGYQHSHLGSACLVMLNNPQQFTAQHLTATDPSMPPGGNTAVAKKF